jgi:hypothetical protein
MTTADPFCNPTSDEPILGVFIVAPALKAPLLGLYTSVLAKTSKPLVPPVMRTCPFAKRVAEAIYLVGSCRVKTEKVFA